MVAAHARGRKGEQLLTPDHYLEVLGYKPGALPGATALAAAKASGAFTPTHDRFWRTARRRHGDHQGTRALIGVLLAHRTLPADAVIAGIERALIAGSTDPVAVLLEARRCTEAGQVAPVIPIGAHTLIHRPPPSLTAYDTLLGNTP